MRVARVAIVMSTVVLAVLSLAACAGHNARPAQSSRNATTTVQRRLHSAQSGRKAETAAQRRLHGIVVAECPTGGSPTIAFIDSATGATTHGLVPAGPGDNPPDLHVPDVCHPALSLEREAFSPDFSREAATNTDEPYGSEHVGYVTLRTGKFVDITARTLGSGFGQRTVHDGDPVFSPDGTRLVWERDGRRLLSYDLLTRQLSGAGELPNEADLTTDLQTYSNAGNTGIVVSPVSGLALLGSTAPSPSGAVAVRWLTGGSNSRSLQVFSGADGFTDTFRKSFDQSSGQLVRVSGMPTDRCDQLSWINAKTVLCTATGVDRSGTSRLYTIPLAPRARATTATVLLPPNDRENRSPVVSPGGSQIAFVASHGDVVTLDRMPAGGGQPVRISSLPGGGADLPVILAWLR